MGRTVKFREGDRVTVEAIVGPDGTLAFHEGMKTAKMAQPFVEVGDYLYDVSPADEDSVSAGGEVVAVLGDKAWIRNPNSQKDSLEEISEFSRVIPREKSPAPPHQKDNTNDQ